MSFLGELEAESYLWWFKALWFMVSVIGFGLSLFVLGEIWSDLFFIFRRPQLSMRRARILVMQQSLAAALVISVSQGVFSGIRFAALIGPNPATSEFRRFWEADGTAIMLLSLMMTLYQVWRIRRKGVINAAVEEEMDKMGEEERKRAGTTESGQE